MGQRWRAAPVRPASASDVIRAAVVFPLVLIVDEILNAISGSWPFAVVENTLSLSSGAIFGSRLVTYLHARRKGNT